MGATALNNYFLEVDKAYQDISMEKILWTPRLKLTLFETLEDGSKDLEWAHEIQTDEKAMSWRLVFSPNSRPSRKQTESRRGAFEISRPGSKLRSRDRRRL